MSPRTSDALAALAQLVILIGMAGGIVFTCTSGNWRWLVLTAFSFVLFYRG